MVRMVSARCSNEMGANRAWSSAKVCGMATCELSAHEATGGTREATTEAHRGGTTDEASPFSGSSGGGFFVESGQLEKALEVEGDTEGPVYEVMQADLKRAKSAASVAPSQCLEQCRSFIEKAKKGISDLEAERTSGMPKMVSKFFRRRFPGCLLQALETFSHMCQNPAGVPLMRHKWSCQQTVCRFRSSLTSGLINSPNHARSTVPELDLTILKSEQVQILKSTHIT